MRDLIIVSLLTVLCSVSFANTNVRTWSLTDGSKIYAELIDYKENADKVHLRIEEKKDRFFQLEDFSDIDQAWLVEWLEMGERLSAKLEIIKGTYTHYNWEGELGIYDFYVYEPSSVVGTSNRPMMILFSPGPKGQRFLLRHLDAAEASGMVVVGLDRFGNAHSLDVAKSKNEQFLELLPKIESTVAHDPRQLFAGGTSGGALQAFGKTVHIDRPWAGVYSNGGWLGPEDYLEEAYPAMRVAIVNGNNDRAANHYLDRDVSILRANGCEVSIISFEGAHQIPPVPSMTKAWDWLLGKEDIEEIN